jgi:hypothetical protein
MFSKFRELLEKFDDEKFFTPVGRQEKIRALRRARLFQILLVFGILVFAFFFEKAGLMNIFLWLSTLYMISFGVIDCQIKMLILYDKTQPKE